MTTPVRMDVGEKDLTTARSSPKPTALLSVIREGVLAQIPESVATCSVQEDVQDPNKVTALPAEISMMTESANRNALQ